MPHRSGAQRKSTPRSPGAEVPQGRIAVVRRPAVKYPPSNRLSPCQAYPEYPFGQQEIGGNEVYDLVRACLADSGADAERFGSADWNPLGQWIANGDRVFVLPNLVTHAHERYGRAGHFARLTHGAVLRPVMDYALLAAGDSRLLGFGNAPLQSCDYERVNAITACREVAEFYRARTGVGIGPHDLRGVVVQWTRYGAMAAREERDVASVSIDLGRDSLLDEFYEARGGPTEVRVGDYPPEVTMGYHAPGKHIYVINRRVLEADVLISVPKLKTHQKVGLTCALKGTVGTVVRKECLAHHRAGGPAEGGDEYPSSSRWRRITSACTDLAAAGGTGLLANAARISAKILYKSTRFANGDPAAGGWYGNDTAWRMALDLARILRFARPDGTMSTVPVRRHLVFVDGVIGGQGDGPLKPSPVELGAVLFAPDPVAADYACALAMGFDPERLPIIRRAFEQRRYPVTELTPGDLRILTNRVAIAGRPRPLKDFRPPRGWRHHIEFEVSRHS